MMTLAIQPFVGPLVKTNARLSDVVLAACPFYWVTLPSLVQETSEPTSVYVCLIVVHPSHPYYESLLPEAMRFTCDAKILFIDLRSDENRRLDSQRCC